MKPSSIPAMRNRWARWLLITAGLAFVVAGPAAQWANAWQPNLTLRIADDAPIQARSEEPFRIVVQNYQSSSIPGLQVNDLLIELRMNDDGTVGFITCSTSSIVDPPEMAAQFWYERPDLNAPERISFDATVSVDTAGFFSGAEAPYQMLTHLYGYLLAVQGNGNGEVDPTGELSDALTEIRGYLIGPDPADPNNTLPAGEISSSFTADPENPVHTHTVEPPDVSGETTRTIASVRSVMSFDLSDRNGFYPVVSGEFTVTLSPASTPATTINASHRHAYGANVGWLDARGDVDNGAVIGQFYSSGYLYAANVGWIGLGTGTPANGYAYANNSVSDWGVNHDGAGGLRGFAYGANIGWVNFEDTGDPRVDLLTGDLSGYAWGANVGWISLNTAHAFVRTDVLDTGPDSDGDGLPDAWEYMMAGDLTTLGPHPADADEDGVSDYHEYLAGTDPLDDTSFFALTDIFRQGDTNWVEWTVQPTRLYRLQQTDSLTGTPVWVDSGHGVMAPDPSATMTRAVVTNAVHQFYRARAIVPLAP